MVDRAMLRGGHEPGARITWHARLRPLLERRKESVLRKILSQPHVAHDPCQAGDELGGFDSPDRVDSQVCIGSRHGYQSDHLPPQVQGWRRLSKQRPNAIIAEVKTSARQRCDINRKERVT